MLRCKIAEKDKKLKFLLKHESLKHTSKVNNLGEGNQVLQSLS